MKLTRQKVLVAVAGVLLAGCAVGPDYKRAEATATMPGAYAGATNEWKRAEPQAGRPKGNWWEMFGDAEWNRLETNAVAANQQLKAAVAAFDQARALTDVSRSGLFPHFDFSPSATPQGDSLNRPINGKRAGKSQTFSFNTFTAPIDLTYEVDLWGRVRRSVESARSQEQASLDDLETVKLGIQAEVATDYFTLHALDAQTALLRTDIEVFQKSLELTQNRRNGGVATDLDVVEISEVVGVGREGFPLAPKLLDGTQKGLEEGAHRI